MGIDSIERWNERHRDRWKFSHTLAGGTRRRCAICETRIAYAGDLWTDGTEYAHPRCAEQANRRAAAAEAI